MVAAGMSPDDSPAEERTLGAAEPQPFEGDPQRLNSRAKRSPMWPIVLISLIVAGATAFYFWSYRVAPPASSVAVPSTEPALAPATPSTASAPAIRYPLEGVAPNVEQAPLPSLQDSDTILLNALTGLARGIALDTIVQHEGIVGRIVATIDNLPRRNVPRRLLPLNSPPGEFAAATSGDTIAIGAENLTRYAPYMHVVEAVDAKTLAALYIRFYPLFQHAYRELGYPDGYFNDRLVDAIDDLLAAPDLQSPVRLTQPKVLYEYADPDLERRSAGQKLMMRIGSNNARIVKAKLTQFRREVVKPRAKP